MAIGYKTGGRAPGTPNKATTEARQAIADFVDGNAHRLQEWLDKIAEKDPEKAFQLFQSVIEYSIPKLQRTDLNAKLSGNVKVDGTINFVRPSN